MEKPWFRKLFSRSQSPVPNANYDDAEVQFGMGLKFANGEGAAQDYVQAAEWYRKAANQSHALAQFNLGTMCALGQGMTRDDAQSLMWFDKAAQQGDAGAQFHLGRTCHRESLGIAPKNALESKIEAYKWYHLAATQGYKGSDTARTSLTLSMTREDVAAGDKRAAHFIAEQAKRAQS